MGQIMEIEDYYGWSTHRPLLQTLVAVYKPQFILELGVGVYSTPIFIDYTPKELMCIENDEKWFNHMKSKFSGCNIILHKLDDSIDLDTFPKQLTKEQTNNITNYYNNLCKQLQSNDSHLKMLFVDNFTCCRAIAINTLYKAFDIVAYHDCEPKGIDWYEYYFVDDLKKEFNSYMLKAPASWAGVFIKHDLDQSKLYTTIIPYINKYCGENRLNNKQVYLEKEY